MTDPNTPSNHSEESHEKRNVAEVAPNLGFAETEHQDLSSRWCYLASALPPSDLYYGSGLGSSSTHQSIERIIKSKELELKFNDDNEVPEFVDPTIDIPEVYDMMRGSHAQEAVSAEIDALLLADPEIQDVKKFALLLWDLMTSKSETPVVTSVRDIIDQFAGQLADTQLALGDSFVILDIAAPMGKQLASLYAVYKLGEAQK